MKVILEKDFENDTFLQFFIVWGNSISVSKCEQVCAFVRGNGYEDSDDSQFEDRYEGMSSESEDEEDAFNPADCIKGV